MFMQCLINPEHCKFAIHSQLPQRTQSMVGFNKTKTLTLVIGTCSIYKQACVAARLADGMYRPSYRHAIIVSFLFEYGIISLQIARTSQSAKLLDTSYRHLIVLTCYS